MESDPIESNSGMVEVPQHDFFRRDARNARCKNIVNFQNLPFVRYRTVSKVLTVTRVLYGNGLSTRHVEKTFVACYTNPVIICVSKGICQVPMAGEIINYKSKNLVTGVYNKPLSFYSTLKSLTKQIITA